MSKIGIGFFYARQKSIHKKAGLSSLFILYCVIDSPGGITVAPLPCLAPIIICYLTIKAKLKNILYGHEANDRLGFCEYEAYESLLSPEGYVRPHSYGKEWWLLPRYESDYAINLMMAGINCYLFGISCTFLRGSLNENRNR
ncbi:hypothetical protein HHX48_16690 [Salinimonas sp. HHU 13199]|uniref:Uncharacterized protein n=1 Tax=Salinimonas profundi TaxID=2729140 RepID=A0ABR8LQN6_9ALTE|nr:hypothetical protein [Salinimonas profundi]MBD3587376.1 hypothetical protein [Salinimonas profundi]